MAPLALRYLSRDVDRHGNTRWYVRLPGQAKVRLRAKLNEDGTASAAFMEEYWRAARGEVSNPRRAARVNEESFQAALYAYYASSEFTGHHEMTQKAKRSVLDRYAVQAGPIALRAFRRDDIERSRDKRRDKPGAADNMVKYLRSFFGWCVKSKRLEANPTDGIGKVNTSSEGWHVWTANEIRKFEDCYPIGTKPRLALALLLHTGGRKGDVVRLGRQHESEGHLSFVQEKNRRHRAVRIEIPLRQELRAIIDATETGDLAYLVSGRGTPFTKESFGNWFRDRCNEAGLPHCSSHGVRKAAATILAENGASAPELCAIFGWSKLETAEIYIRKAQKKRMAGNAFARLPIKSETPTVPLSDLDKTGETKRQKS